MEYYVIFFFAVVTIAVLLIERADARQKKIAFSGNYPDKLNPTTSDMKDSCPNCSEVNDTNTAVCKHCGTFVCYFWYKT